MYSYIQIYKYISNNIITKQIYKILLYVNKTQHRISKKMSFRVCEQLYGYNTFYRIL